MSQLAKDLYRLRTLDTSTAKRVDHYYVEEDGVPRKVPVAILPGVPRVLGPFVFNHDDAGLNDGIAFYTPTVGDILLDAWISVIEAFDGTTPIADIGTFVGSTTGVVGTYISAGGIQLAVEDSDYGGAGLLASDVNTSSSVTGRSGAGGTRGTPSKFTAANPLKFVASQDGQAGGTAVGGTTGIAHVYIIVATPVVL